MNPTRALGINCRIESSIPSPARSTGTSTPSRSSWKPRAGASGVRTGRGRTAKARVASYNIRQATSPSTRRNSCGRVRRSRNRVRLCCTSGCVMTVTPFTSMQESGREKVELAGLEPGNVHDEIDFDDRRFALAEDVQVIAQFIALLVLDEIGVFNSGDSSRALYRVLERAQSI